MSFFDIISVGGIRRSRKVELADLRSGARQAEQAVPGFPDCTAMLLDVEGAAAFEPEWRDLVGRVLEPNFCYEPGFAIAAARHLTDARNVRFVMLWRPKSRSPRQHLIGCFPVTLATDIGAPLLRGWVHPQISAGAPLVDAENARIAVSAFLAWVAASKGRPVGVLFPRLPVEGRFAVLLREVLAENGRAPALFSEHQRAMLPLVGETDRGLSSKKKKELRRQYRRLSETGELVWSSATETADIRAAIERFVALEATGWKGKAGTAFLQEPGRISFLRAATRAFAATGQLSVESIELDGKTVASGLLVGAGRTGYFWKIAYDEAQSAFSPGVQLTLGLAERAKARGTMDVIDSCAISDHPMIDHVWRERLGVADTLVPLSTRQTLRFGFARAREAARRDLRQRLKTAVYKLQGRTAS